MSEKNLQTIVSIVDLVIPIIGLVGKLVERSAQEGALTPEQRERLADAAEAIFSAASSAPPPPDPKEDVDGTPV